MADRTSAGIFGDIFDSLAEMGEVSKEELVERFWNKARRYDFSTDQMDCAIALVKLGLAIECKCGSYVYKGESASWHEEPECNREDWKDFARQD